MTAHRDRRFIGPPSVTMWTRPNSSSGVFLTEPRRCRGVRLVTRLVREWLHRGR